MLVVWPIKFPIGRDATGIRQTCQQSADARRVSATGVDGQHAPDAAGGNHGDTARLPPGATPFHCRIHSYYYS
jgi:hypothetical protein